MNTPKNVSISKFNHAKDSAPKRVTLNIDELARQLTTPLALTTTAEEFFGGTDDERATIKKSVRAWSPALYPDGVTRGIEGVEALSCIALDVDADERATVESVAERLRLQRWRGAIYTTLKDRRGAGGKPRRLRVVVFCDRTMTPQEYLTARDESARCLGLKFDPATKTDTARIFYVAAQLKGGTFESADVPGEPANVGELLAQAQARTDSGRKSKGGADSGRKSKGGAVGTVSAALPPGPARVRFASALGHLVRFTPEGKPCTRGGYALAYDTWRKLGCAVAHGFGKTEEGLALFDLISQRAVENYDADSVDAEWAKITPDGGITAEWVTAEATRRGWADPNPPRQRAARLSELAMGEALAARCAARFLLVSGEKEPRYRDGGRWRRDDSLREMLTEYKALLRARTDEARDAEDGRLLSVVAKLMIGLERRKTFENIVAFAKMALPVAAADDFDAIPELLGVSNGVLDIIEARVLTEAEISERGALVSRECGTAFDPGARCPQWERFVSSCCCGDVDMVGYLQEAAGSSLYGGETRRNVFIAVGSGRNGKSVWLTTLARVFGDYGGVIRKEALMRADGGRSSGGNYALATLHGKRLVWCSETTAGEVLADAVIKAASGGDRLQVRQIFEADKELTPRFTVWMATNHAPIIRDTSPAIWERLRLLPFEAKIPDNEVITDLADRLTSERAGILNWLLEGFQRWHARGKAFAPPERVVRASEAYRRDSDTLGQWIEDCAALNVNSPEHEKFITEAGKLHASYVVWCGMNSVRAMSRQGFSRALEERGVSKRRTMRARQYVGIALVGEAEEKSRVHLVAVEAGAVARAGR